MVVTQAQAIGVRLGSTLERFGQKRYMDGQSEFQTVSAKDLIVEDGIAACPAGGVTESMEAFSV